MKIQACYSRAALAALVLLSTLNPQLSTVFAQGTAFTYQGQLTSGNSPANGSYDLTFALFNAGGGGAQSGVTLTNTATAVTNGLFIVTLDFGGGIFNGTNYWLAIGVRTNGNGTFTALLPRQQITPVPYAIYSPNAGTSVSATTAAAANSVASGSVTAAGIASGQVVKSLDGLHDAVTVAGGANISVTSVGNNITIASTVSGGSGGSTNGWSLTGNAGTVTTNFLGTTDNQNLQLKVYGQRALLLQPSLTTNAPNLIGGSSLNSVSGVGDTIAGGYQNIIYPNFGFIGGGSNCTIYSASDFGFIGGGNNNSIASFAANGFIGGGTKNTIGGGSDAIAGGTGNSVSSGSYYCAIGGGQYNIIQDGGEGLGSPQNAIIAGGISNVVNASDSFIGGGYYNTIQTPDAVIAGGYSNVVSDILYINDSESDTVGGGEANTAEGIGATVPGGENNVAEGDDSFAAGIDALAENDHSFVWGSGGANRKTSFASTGDDQFLIGPNVSVGINTNNPQSALDVSGDIHTSGTLYADYSVVVGNNKVILYPSGNIQAQGNISSVNNISAYTVNATTIYASSTVYANGVALTSDRNAKENFKPVDNQAVLAKVAALPVTEWNYKRDSQEVQHIGPMAQDFQAAFGLDGADDKHISVVDEGGVALAAIQGLNQKLEQQNRDKNAEIQDLKQSVADLKKMVQSLAAMK